MDTQTFDTQSHPLRLDSAALSDPGSERDLNQDVVFHQVGQLDPDGNVGLFFVCDGMGGHTGGEIASRIASDTITAELATIFAKTDGDTQDMHTVITQLLRAALDKANAAIRDYAQSHRDVSDNMGATVTLVLVYEAKAYIVNAGDSRTYAVRNDELVQITNDHSLAAELAAKGIISFEEVPTHPRSNVIFRALGIDETLKSDVYNWSLQPGDMFLLCSNGPWKALTDLDELQQTLCQSTSAADICQQLVAQAKERDGSDNISAIVVKIEHDPNC